MKKTLLGIFIGLSLTLTVAFKVANYEVRKNTAEVNQMQGLWIFTDSRPVQEYNYLGSVKTSSIFVS